MLPPIAPRSDTLLQATYLVPEQLPPDAGAISQCVIGLPPQPLVVDHIRLFQLV